MLFRSAYPLFRQSFFDPDNPLYVGLGLSFEQTVTFARGLSVTAAEYATFYDTFDQIQRTSNSVLPHVRSDFDRYLKKAKNGIDGLTGDYYFKLGPEIFARASAGLLEDFFAGAGGEVLYRPFRRRWALGANIWAVRQRDYDEMFGLLDYKVVTGHMSLYYDSPWYDVLIAVHAGQYLAGDRGATFE